MRERSKLLTRAGSISGNGDIVTHTHNSKNRRRYDGGRRPWEIAFRFAFARCLPHLSVRRFTDRAGYMKRNTTANESWPIRKAQGYVSYPEMQKTTPPVFRRNRFALRVDQVHAHAADVDRTVCCAFAKARGGFQGPRAIDGDQIEAAEAFAASIGVLDESNRRVFEA